MFTACGPRCLRQGGEFSRLSRGGSMGLVRLEIIDIEMTGGVLRRRDSASAVGVQIRICWKNWSLRIGREKALIVAETSTALSIEAGGKLGRAWLGLKQEASPVRRIQ